MKFFEKLAKGYLIYKFLGAGIMILIGVDLFLEFAVEMLK